MKKLFALLLIVMLLMTACQPAGPAATVTEPTDPSTEATEPSSEATDPPPYLPENYYIFRFDGEQPSGEYEIDISGLQDGWLYSYNEEEDKIYLIADWNVSIEEEVHGEIRMHGLVQTYYGCIHFASADRKTVYRSSYTGENRTVVYETEHEITHIDYSEGVYLCVTEENNRAVLVDVSVGTVVAEVEHDWIEHAMYFPNGVKGPYIAWIGNEHPPERTQMFLYYPETGELVEQFVL